jgi:hypothetical protein
MGAGLGTLWTLDFIFRLFSFLGLVHVVCGVWGEFVGILG